MAKGKCTKKGIKYFLAGVLAVCAILSPLTGYADGNNAAGVTVKYNKEDQKVLDNIPNIGCKSVYIAEPVTGKVIYEKNAHEVMYPASTTKLLTALLTLEKCQMTDKETVSQNAVDLVPFDYVTADLRPGEEISVKDLLYALLLPSANEAANVLAEHISGSVEAFAELCNQRAKELGCENLHFVNPNGIHNEEHYCTAYDLYLITKECRKYDIFKDIAATKSYDLPATELYPETRRLENTNELLYEGAYYYENCTGIKTGYTDEAGQCFVGSSKKDGIELISVVLGGGINEAGANERFFDTKQLFEFAYANYSLKQIAAYGDRVATLKVGKATSKTSSLDVTVGADISAIVPNIMQADDKVTTAVFTSGIEAPIRQNQVLGSITYYVDGLVYTADIIASHPVEKLPYTLYNIIVIAVVVLTVAIYAVLLKKAKNSKKGIFYSFVIVIITEIVCLIIIMEAGSYGAATKITGAEPNVNFQSSWQVQTGEIEK